MPGGRWGAVTPSTSSQEWRLMLSSKPHARDYILLRGTRSDNFSRPGEGTRQTIGVMFLFKNKSASRVRDEHKFRPSAVLTKIERDATETR